MNNNYKCSTLFTLLLCTLSFFSSATGAEKALDASQLSDQSVPLTEFFAVLEDPSHQLTLADHAGITDQDAVRLWRDRVQLMNSLVTVRYAEAQRAAFFVSNGRTL